VSPPASPGSYSIGDVEILEGQLVDVGMDHELARAIVHEQPR
jgi:hypothetical protein